MVLLGRSLMASSLLLFNLVAVPFVLCLLLVMIMLLLLLWFCFCLWAVPWLAWGYDYLVYVLFFVSVPPHGWLGVFIIDCVCLIFILSECVNV